MSATGHTYYVATNGSDSHSGSSGSPFKTIRKCATKVVAGDTCQIAGGDYRETVTPARGGTANARITAPGARVTVNGADPVTGWGVVSPAELAGLRSADPFLAASEFTAGVQGGHIYRTTVTSSTVGSVTAPGMAPCVGLSPNQRTNYTLSGKLVVDVGAVHVCCAVDLAGTVIHHNQFHDPAAPPRAT